MLLCTAGVVAQAGWSFDTGFSPEVTRDLLAAPGAPAAPTGSWLRLRDMERSAVRGPDGAEVPLLAAGKSAVTVAARRQALADLRARGYRLVAFLEWSSDSWPGGVRPDQPLRRLPLDLREAAARCRQLAETYGDLIDSWEIENEPDITFVEENPETYAAFLKACYLGVKAGRMDAQGQGGKGKGQGAASEGREAKSGKQSTNPEPVALGARRAEPPGAPAQPPLALGSLPLATDPSSVLMAAFALPPGPYFEAWVANDGLRYTDGFNYHYYGYPEDFTGAYQQFHAAVTRAPAVTAAGEAVLQTQFYPEATRWTARTLRGFTATEAESQANRAALQARPLATAEPALEPQGRWLVTPGTTVRETAEGWEFTVTQPGPGPLRPAMAELPLADTWPAGAEGMLVFEYSAKGEGQSAKGEGRGAKSEEQGTDSAPSALATLTPATNATSVGYPQTTVGDAQRLGVKYPLPPDPYPLSEKPTRELPVFLTEYGYGLLDRQARNTVAGREAQRAWFAQVIPQIDALRIEGAMVFYLKPNFEDNRNEFGLLMEERRAKSEEQRAEGKGQGAEGEAPSVKPSGALVPAPLAPGTYPFATASAKGYALSPALATLLEEGKKVTTPQGWPVATTAPSPVVLDFVAASGLSLNKTYRGYWLQAGTATGRLIVYHFGREPIAGELTLGGTGWTLAGGARHQQIRLEPGERREFPVEIRPESAARFGPQTATARFVADTGRPAERARSEAPSAPPSDTHPSSPLPPRPSLLPQVPPGLLAEFEASLRTRNGNLYYVWPRLQAGETWRWYYEALANFTPAFYGRHHLPAAFGANQPAALVFFFRPREYPVVYRVRHARVVEYVPPKDAGTAEVGRQTADDGRRMTDDG